MDWVLFIVGIVIIGGIYAVLSLGLNLEYGFAGLLDLGLVAYFGLGAYSYVLLSSNAKTVPSLGLPIIVGFLAAGLIAAVIARLVALLTLRLQEEYLLLITLAFAEVMAGVFQNETWLTGGVKGIVRLSRPFSDSFSWQGYQYFFAAAIIAIIVTLYFAFEKIRKAPVGRTFQAIKDNQDFALMLGKDVTAFKTNAHVIAAFTFGLAGPLYVWYSTMVVPGMFTSDLTFTVWIALVLGGLASNRGAIGGAFILFGLLGLTRLFNFSHEQAVIFAGIRQMILGLALMAVVRWLPKGIIGTGKGF